MSLVSKQDVGELKAFARTMMWAFPAVFMGLLPWVFSHSIPLWPLAITFTLIILYFVFPTGIYYPYRVWMAIAGVLGWVNTRILLGIAFYLLIFPIGLLMRSLGKLQYKGSPDRSQSTYWISRNDKLTKQRLKDPF